MILLSVPASVRCADGPSEELFGLRRRMCADGRERAAALVHDRHGTRVISFHGDGAQEVAVPRLAWRVAGDEPPRAALRLWYTLLRELRIADRLQTLQLDVAQRPSLRLDPRCLLTGQEAARRDL